MYQNDILRNLATDANGWSACSEAISTRTGSIIQQDKAALTDIGSVIINLVIHFLQT